MSRGLVTPGRTIKERAARAVGDPGLQRALHNLDVRLHTARHAAEQHGDWKPRAAAIRREVLDDLDGWISRAEESLTRAGAVVHHGVDVDDTRRIVVDLARRAGAGVVVKSKSMATEEIELSEAMAAAGIEAVETDLGEYVAQVAGERPSHIITPVIHKTVADVAQVLGAEAGTDLPDEREALTAWTRERLRARFFAADVGVTGANFVAADTGTIVLVSNEGNARLCTSLPRVQVAVVPVEKIVPRLADLAVLVPFLTATATGQPLSNYVSLLTGPRRPGEVDGPEALHVVLLDHHRRELVGTPYEEMLACIRCGACLNVCPVYRTIGGHAYDSAYPGPMGQVLTPLLWGGEAGRDLPWASSLCGACAEACPVEIPLADLLVRLRADLRAPGPVVAPGRPGAPRPTTRPDAAPLGGGRGRPTLRRVAFGAWSAVWSTPVGYRASLAAARAGGRLLGGRDGWLRRAPGLGRWTGARDVPAPAARSFREGWATRSPSSAGPAGGTTRAARATRLRRAR